MKKIICILLVILVIFSLTACAEKEKTQNPIVTQESVENESLYPSPTTITWEESENNLGARYVFTLEEFNDMLNKRCENLADSGVAQYFELDRWEKMSETLVDDKGIEYTSYYYATDTLTITAAVENESNKVLNVGCGTAYTEFVNSDADYQYTVMLTSAILAMVAGGYEDDDLEFLYYIFFDSAKNNTAFFYNNGVYMLNLSKEKDEKNAALLFMISPCNDEILEKWELTDYKKYDKASVKA